MKTKSLENILRSPEIIRNEDHVYVNKNGEFYTGTTTISEAWDKSFFLGPWYAKEMANELLAAPFDAVQQMSPPQFQKFVETAKGAAKRKSEKAKQDGTAAHEWIETFIGSQIDSSVELKPTPESKEAQNAINAFVEWKKDRKIEWLASEEIVASHDYRIAGTLDAIAVIDGLTYLVDFKTSSQISASYLLQCAGYDIQLREMGLQVMGYLILRIPKDGKPAESLTIVNRDDMSFYRETFLQQREAHKFYVFAENKLKEQGRMKTDKHE